METYGLEWCLSQDDEFRYQLLSRLQSDCDYYLGNGGGYAGHLWAKNEAEQIETMKALWNSFSDEGKPEWLTWEQIEHYETDMGVEEDAQR